MEHLGHKIIENSIIKEEIKVNEESISEINKSNKEEILKKNYKKKKKKKKELLLMRI